MSRRYIHEWGVELLNGQGYLLFNLKFEFVFYGNCLADCCHFVYSVYNGILYGGRWLCVRWNT